MAEILRIALLMGQDAGFCRGVLRGIHTFAIHKTHWNFLDAPPHLEVLEPLRRWRPHGIIAHLYDRQFARRVIAMRKPLVNTTSTLADLKVPLVEVDHRQVGRLAAEHFLERGFRNLGYFGSAWTGFSKQREEGFRVALAEAGQSLSVCYGEYLPRPPMNANWMKEARAARTWLRRLSRPAAILAASDVAARHLAEICRQAGVRVPEDVALLGVDNDELECLLSNPPLSSVVNPAEQIGYEAARLLDQLLAGRSLAQETILLPPPHVITRQSTDVIAIADEDVSAAIAFIRDHLAEQLSVAAVAAQVSVSRRGLERRFQEFLGRTILQEIQRARIERAKRLLTETDVPISVVVRRSGFSNGGRLAVVFRQMVGVCPTAYRARFQVRS